MRSTNHPPKSKKAFKKWYDAAFFSRSFVSSMRWKMVKGKLQLDKKFKGSSFHGGRSNDMENWYDENGNKVT